MITCKQQFDWIIKTGSISLVKQKYIYRTKNQKIFVKIIKMFEKKCKQQKEKCVWHEVYTLFLFYKLKIKCLFFKLMINQLSRSCDMELFSCSRFRVLMFLLLLNK